MFVSPPSQKFKIRGGRPEIHVPRQQGDKKTQHRTSHFDTTPGMTTPGAPQAANPSCVRPPRSYSHNGNFPFPGALTPSTSDAKSRPYALRGPCHSPLSLIFGRFSLLIAARGSLMPKGCTNLAVVLVGSIAASPKITAGFAKHTIRPCRYGWLVQRYFSL